jgi:hypothetical protein
LQVLELEEHLGAGELRQRAAVHAGRGLERAGDALGGGANVVEAHHGVIGKLQQFRAGLIYRTRTTG